MPRIEDLKQNMLDMSEDQLRDHIRKIREDRVIRKRDPKKAKTTKEKTIKEPKSSIKSALDALTPEQIAALLGEYGEQGDGDTGSGS